MSNYKKAVLILNSPEFNSKSFIDFLSNDLKKNDDIFFVIVDGGMNHFRNLKSEKIERPIIDLFIGDMDSASDINYSLDSTKIRINKEIVLDKNKDYSDYHFALMEIEKLGIEDIIVFAGIGGRIDHFMSIYESSILFCSKFNLSISLIGVNEVIFFRNKSFDLKNDIKVLNTRYSIIDSNKTVSIFSGTEKVTNLSLGDGFKFRIENFTLERDNPIGLSNIILDSEKLWITFDELEKKSKNKMINKNVLILVLPTNL